jgi:hypothetical protein
MRIGGNANDQRKTLQRDLARPSVNYGRRAAALPQPVQSEFRPRDSGIDRGDVVEAGVDPLPNYLQLFRLQRPDPKNGNITLAQWYESLERCASCLHWC